ncbi:MAG: hypothetical protein V2A54_00660 [Bacteroidota bacterium]
MKALIHGEYSIMTNINSEINNVDCSPEQVFEFLCDFNNFEKLLPDQISNWKASKETCSFTIKNMGDLELKIARRVEFSMVTYEATGRAPFPFSLNFKIDQRAQFSTTQVLFVADLPTFIELMAKSPLTHFVGTLNSKLKETLEKESE